MKTLRLPGSEYPEDLDALPRYPSYCPRVPPSNGEFAVLGAPPGPSLRGARASIATRSENGDSAFPGTPDVDARHTATASAGIGDGAGVSDGTQSAGAGFIQIPLVSSRGIGKTLH